MVGRFCTRALSTVLAAVFAAGFPFVPCAAADDAPRVLVAPFRTIGVSSDFGPKISDILSDEIHEQDGLLLVTPTPAAPPPTASVAVPDGAKAALSRIQRGESMIRRLKLRPGASEVEAGLEDYASFPAYEDARKVREAYVQLAVAYSRLGANDSAEAALQNAVRVAPDAHLSGNYPPVFRTAFNEAKRRVNNGSKGAVSVSGDGQVQLDGRSLGAAPLHSEGIPVGDHFLKVTRSDGSVWGLKLAVAEGNNTVSIPPGEGAAPVVADSPALAPLEKNRIDAGVLTALGGLAKSANADFVVFGAVYKSGDGLGVAPHLYNARTRRSVALVAMHVDTDMVSAGIEGNKVATQVSQLAGAFPRVAEVIPGPVASELLKQTKPTAVASDVPKKPEQPAQPIVVKAPEEQPKIVLVTPQHPVVEKPVETTPAAGLGEPDESSTSTEIPSDQSNHVWIWVAAGAAVLAGGAVGGYFIYKNASTPNTGTAQLNFQ